MPNYDVDYFLKKFEAIAEEKWITGQHWGDDDTACALGHCGGELTKEGVALIALGHLLTHRPGTIPRINDGKDERFPQPTPRLRILAALRYIKEKQCPSSS